MTTEDALPVVAHLYIDRRDAFQYATNACAAETLPGAEPLVKQSDALAALTLVQAERDAMQQERDELRAALRELLAQVDKFCETEGEANFYTGDARAALAPKATQPTSEASRGR